MSHENSEITELKKNLNKLSADVETLKKLQVTNMEIDLTEEGADVEDYFVEAKDGGQQGKRNNRFVWSGEWSNSTKKNQEQLMNNDEKETEGGGRKRGKSAGRSKREWYFRRSQWENYQNGRNSGENRRKDYRNRGGNYLRKGDRYDNFERGKRGGQGRARGDRQGGRGGRNGNHVGKKGGYDGFERRVKRKGRGGIERRERGGGGEKTTAKYVSIHKQI